MKMVVLGATGLLGQAFMTQGRLRGSVVIGAARTNGDVQLDITNSKALLDLLERERPDMIVNCAALVDVGACEADPGAAYRLNAEPLIKMAHWTRATGAKLVQISTDHFFAGEGPEAHDENADVTIFNQYAATKYAGERFALLSHAALVLRTSIVGIRGWERPSFAEWAIAAVSNDERMTLFADAYTSSIDTGAFASAALDLVEKGATGLLNLAASRVYSKEQFIRALAEQLDKTLTRASVGSVAALEPPRPKSLGLDVSRAETLLGRPLPDLQAVVRAIVSDYEGQP